MAVKNFISIIICTYNRAYLLERALQSLSLQTLNPERFEVIVVDDGSEDETAEVCGEMRRNILKMKYIFAGKNVGLSSAANMGIRSAKGSHLLFTDDDCIAKEDWAERLSAALEKAPVVAGVVASPKSNFIKLCHNIAQFHPFMPGRKGATVEFIAGANMGFRRSLLEEFKGFREGEAIAPDMELILRCRLKGYKIHLAPDAVVTHDPERTTLANIFRYSSRHASATIILRNEYRSLLRTPFILQSPVLLLVTAPIIALKVTVDIYFRNPNLARLFRTAPVVYALKLAWCWGAAQGLRNRKNLR